MYKHLISTIALGILATAVVRAENAVILESFEDGVASASLMTQMGGRPLLNPPGVALSQYTATGVGDANVTEGGKSLKVVLSGKPGFSGDFQIKLSAAASAKVHAAIASPDTARYILRYDVIFPPAEDMAYCNSKLYLGDNLDALISIGGKRSMSVALDLLTGLPATGPVTLVIADDFGVKGTFTNITLYIDNIRLVDTYAPGAKAVTYVLQSFEDTNNPTGGATDFTMWGTTARTKYASYSAADPKDPRVTEGQHALEVTYSNPSLWQADFTIPFKDTKLGEVLKLDQAEEERPKTGDLGHYTFRFDVTYPDVGAGEWMNTTFHTLETYLPTIQSRQGKPKGQRQTYSVTLDQTEWGNKVDVYPALAIISQGPQKASSAKLYFDNFRLIDTGGAAQSEARH